MAVLLSTALFEENATSKRASAEAVRRFLPEDEIRQVLVRSKNYKLDGTDPSLAALLLIFQTSLQQTWLAKTAKRLYCILDDRRKPEANVNWSMRTSEFLDGSGQVSIPIDARPSSELGEGYGSIDIGPKHKDWLFSTKLFTLRPVKDEVRALLMR